MCDTLTAACARGSRTVMSVGCLVPTCHPGGAKCASRSDLFDGCPNWRAADQRLREALGSIGRNDREVHRLQVSTPAQAEALRFTGSPTIRIDGEDPFATEDDRVGFACRMYRTPSGFDGPPIVAQLVEALA